jgi:hypothetical protein
VSSASSASAPSVKSRPNDGEDFPNRAHNMKLQIFEACGSLADNVLQGPWGGEHTVIRPGALRTREYKSVLRSQATGDAETIDYFPRWDSV